MSFANDIKKIRNYFFPAFGNVTGNPYGMRQASAAKPNSYISPVQFQRIKVDIQSLVDAINEAEQAYYPHRVKLQRIYQDTVRNGQIEAVMNRLKDLVLLKGFEYKVGDKVDEKATALLDKEWFHLLMSYIMDALFYGYTLVGLGDLVDNEFPKIQLVKRWNVSPDRHNLTSYVYSLSGINFLDPENKDESGNSFYDWTIWVETPTETGASPCGYGLLYKLAYYEILIRHNTGYNATALELFGQPMRVGSTTKTDEYERAEFAASLRDMGSSGWMLKDPTDDIELIEASNSSTKQNGFENFDARQLKMINKTVFGHADALDSQTGKLGGEDAAKEAIEATEKAKTRWMENVLNRNVIPKLQNLGLPLPMGGKIVFKNDKEKAEARRSEDEANKLTADLAKTMKDAGMEMDEKYFFDRTQIPAKRIEAQEPPLNPVVKEKLKNLYNA